MKTEELIEVLAAEGARRRPALRLVMVRWLLAGSAVSIVGFLLALGPRPDLLEALSSWRFCLKLALVGAAAAFAFASCLRLAGPTERRPFSRASLVVPVALAAALGAELVVSPAETWAARAVGSNALVCLVAVPALSLPLLIAGLAAMRRGAPASAARAGAAVGSLAAALGAALYALHCADDSPLFVALWYGLAALPAIGAGAIVGRRVLRW